MPLDGLQNKFHQWYILKTFIKKQKYEFGLSCFI